MELNEMYKILILSGISRDYIDSKISKHGFTYETLTGILYEYWGFENFDEYLEGRN